MKTFIHNLLGLVRCIKNMRLVVVVSVLATIFTPLYVHAADPLTSEILPPISSLLIQLGGIAVSIGGGLLDRSIVEFVLQMGQVGNNQGVERGWILIRDLVNLTFVFGLLYVGIMTILRGEGADTRRWLVQIIIGALLVNFSLFFARVIIDITNVAATQIYNEQITEFTDETGSISSAFMDHLGIQQVGPAAFTTTPSTNLSFLQALLFMILCLVAAFVFMAGAVLITIRFAVLILLMILSPVMFVATFLPVAGGWAKRWWDTMIGQSIFAPAMLFMNFLALTVLNSLSGRNLDALEASASASGTIAQNVSILTTYTLVVIMMIAGLIIAKQMGAYGASAALALGNYARRQTQGFFYRRGVGQYADRWAQRREERGKPSTSTMSRIASGLAGYKAGGTFSATQIREAREKAARNKALYKQNTETERKIQLGQNTTDTNSQIYTDMERAVSGATSDQLIKLLGKHGEGSTARAAIIKHMSAPQFDAVMKAKPEDLNDEEKALIAAARRKAVLGTLSMGTPNEPKAGNVHDASMAQLTIIGEAIISNPDVVGKLTFSQVDEIKKSDKFTESEKGRIVSGHKEALKAAVRTTDNFGQFMSERKLREGDVAKVAEMMDLKKDDDVASLAKVAPYITPGIWREIKSTSTKAALADRNGGLVTTLPESTRRIIEGWENTPAGRVAQAQNSTSQFLRDSVNNMRPSSRREPPERYN